MEMKAETAMDQIDKQILAQLQVNAAQPVAAVGNAVLAPDSTDGRDRFDSQTRCLA